MFTSKNVLTHISLTEQIVIAADDYYTLSEEIHGSVWTVITLFRPE